MPVINVGAQNKEVVKAIMKMVNEGHGYEEIAKAINKETKGMPEAGYVGRNGKIKPWNRSVVSGIALANGVRKRQRENSPERPMVNSNAPSATRRRRVKNGASRWALLDAIESCPGLTPESRQALMHLAFQELNK